MELVAITFNKITYSQKFKYYVYFVICGKSKRKQKQLYPNVKKQLLGTKKNTRGIRSGKSGMNGY